MVARPFPTLLASLVVAGVSFHADLSAQVVPEHLRLVGIVVDFDTADPVEGVLVVAAATSAVATPDSLGTFALVLPRDSAVTLEFRQLGYRTTSTTVRSPVGQDTTVFTIAPDPIVLEGLEVSVARQGLRSVLDRLDSRRRSFAGRVLLIDRERLARSAAPSAREVVQAAVPGARPCNVDAVGNLCFGRGSRARPPRVCIDGVRALGGAADLRAYDLDEFHSIEIYSRGRLIVAYTNAYLARALARPLAVQPFPELEC